MKKDKNFSFLRALQWVAPMVLLLSGFGYGGTVAVVFGAANDGGFGMRINVTDTVPTYVRTDIPNDETRYRARFYFRLDGLNLPEGASVRIFSANKINDDVQLELILEQTGGETLLSWSARVDGGGAVAASTPQKVVVGAGYHRVEIDWLAGVGTGYLALWYDEAFLVGLRDLDNDQGRVDYAMLGCLAGLNPSISGFIDLDDFQSQRTCYIGALSCDSRCRFDAMLPSWPNMALANLIYFASDACFNSVP